MLPFTIAEVLLVLTFATFSRTESYDIVTENSETDRLRLRLRRNNAEDGGGEILLKR